MSLIRRVLLAFWPKRRDDAATASPVFVEGEPGYCLHIGRGFVAGAVIGDGYTAGASIAAAFSAGALQGGGYVAGADQITGFGAGLQKGKGEC